MGPAGLRGLRDPSGRIARVRGGTHTRASAVAVRSGLPGPARPAPAAGVFIIFPCSDSHWTVALAACARGAERVPGGGRRDVRPCDACSHPVAYRASLVGGTDW